MAMLYRIVFLSLVATLLTACASTSASIADAWPQAIGGMPSGVPPRRGTPEYDKWMAERAAEATRPKGGQQANEAAPVN